MDKQDLPTREDILSRMWTLANAGAADAVGMACDPEGWAGRQPRLDGVTEFKRGSNGVIEVKFVDRGKLLELLLGAVDRGSEDRLERFLQAVEGED